MQITLISLAGQPSPVERSLRSMATVTKTRPTKETGADRAISAYRTSDQVDLGEIEKIQI
jgi:hypothetical protein